MGALSQLLAQRRGVGAPADRAGCRKHRCLRGAGPPRARPGEPTLPMWHFAAEVCESDAPLQDIRERASELEDPSTLRRFADALAAACSRKSQQGEAAGKALSERQAAAGEALWRFVEAQRTYQQAAGISEEHQNAQLFAFSCAVWCLTKSGSHKRALRLFRSAQRDIEWVDNQVSVEMLRAGLFAAAGVPDVKAAMETLRLLQRFDTRETKLQETEMHGNDFEGQIETSSPRRQASEATKLVGKAMEAAVNANDMDTARALALELIQQDMADEYIIGAVLKLARSNNRPSEVLELWQTACEQKSGPPNLSAPIMLNRIQANIDVGTESARAEARSMMLGYVQEHIETITFRTAKSILAAAKRMGDWSLFFELVHFVGRKSKLGTRNDWWNICMADLHEEEMYKAVRAIFNLMRETYNIEPDSMSYSFILSACGEADWGRTAERIALDAYARGVPVNGHGLKNAFRAIGNYVSCDRALEVHRLLASLDSEMAEPSLLTCLITCKENERPEIAREIFDDYISNGCNSNTNLWSTLISTYQTKAMADEALSTLYEMRDYGYKPTVVTYGSLLAAFTAQQRFDEAIEIARKAVTEDNVEFNQISFRNVLASASRSIPDIDGLFRLMDVYQNEFGVQLNPAIASEVVNALRLAGRINEALSYGSDLVKQGMLASPEVNQKEVLANAIVRAAMQLVPEGEMGQELLLADWARRMELLNVSALCDAEKDIATGGSSYYGVSLDRVQQRIQQFWDEDAGDERTTARDARMLSPMDMKALAIAVWTVALSESGVHMTPRNYTFAISQLLRDCSATATNRMTLALERLADSDGQELDSIFFQAATERVVAQNSLQDALDIAKRACDRRVRLQKAFAGLIAYTLADKADPIDIEDRSLDKDTKEYCQEAETLLNSLRKFGVPQSKNLNESLARIRNRLGKHSLSLRSFNDMRGKDIRASRRGAEAALESALAVRDLIMASDAFSEAYCAATGNRGALEEHIPEDGRLDVHSAFDWVLDLALSTGGGERGAERLVTLREHTGAEPSVDVSIRVAQAFETVEHHRQLAVLSAINTGMASNGARASQLLLSLAAMRERREDTIAAVQAALAVRPVIVDDAVRAYCEYIDIWDAVHAQRSAVVRAANEALLQEGEQLNEAASGAAEVDGVGDGEATASSSAQDDKIAERAADDLLLGTRKSENGSALTAVS